jgi:hypothetical protein
MDRATQHLYREAPFPFTNFRAGQRELARSVYRAVQNKFNLFVEAPTGMGKTLATLYAAIKALPLISDGKIFYVTAKTPGRFAAQDALQKLRDTGVQVRSVSLTAKAKIRFAADPSGCDAGTCPFRKGYCPIVVAQEPNRWELDSPPGNPNVSKPDAQQVYEILLKMLDRWNAHDIEGYMEVYWKSPELLVVVDSEQFNGWQQLHDSYLNGYPDRNAMGFIQPKRIQVKLLKPDLALPLTWWSVTFPSSKQSVVGNSTMNLQKFNDGWKIVASHTSAAQI